MRKSGSTPSLQDSADLSFKVNQSLSPLLQKGARHGIPSPKGGKNKDEIDQSTQSTVSPQGDKQGRRRETNKVKSESNDNSKGISDHGDGEQFGRTSGSKTIKKMDKKALLQRCGTLTAELDKIQVCMCHVHVCTAF
jgi:hypothetical protein